jgi:predicted ArsR family transcriptional regulator
MAPGTWGLKCTAQTVQNASVQSIDRHALLADPTRRAILDALGDAPADLGVRELAIGLGLHANSVRDQLRRLEAAGLVRVSVAAPVGRGRPAMRYGLAPQPEDPYRTLAGVLADQVAALPDAAPASEAAGERWGRRAAASSRAASSSRAAAGDPVDAVVALLAEAGFDPEPVDAEGREIRLRACPFLPIDRRHLPVVCGVHLGFVRGALRELGSPRDAIAIEPFVRPDLCVARLGRMPGA